MTTLLSPIPDFVRKELTRRKNIVASPHASSTDLLWAHGKTAWVKMQSNAEFSSEKHKPASYTITSGWFGANDTLKFQEAHTPIELKPRPGITSLSSTIKGHLGIMREVVVKFKAYTLPQLEQLQDLFMIPGIGVLVEWGWSIADAEILSIPLRSTWPKDGNDKWLKNTVQDKIKKGGGRYDALFGLVCNFNISFTDDGTWDCETTIVGPGALTVDINLKTPGNALDKKLSEYLENRINEHMSGKKLDGAETNNVQCGTFNGIRDDLSVVVSPSEQQAKKSSTGKEVKVKSSQTNMYVTWEFIENSLNTFFDKAEASNYAKNKFLVSSLPGDKLRRIPCNSFAYDDYIWRSYSPTEILIPQHPSSLRLDKEVVGPPGYQVRDLRNFNVFDDKQHGDLASVWLNWNTVVKPAFENSETMQEAINKLLNRLNDAAGGVWDLQLMFDGENYASYKVIDFKCTYGMTSSAAPYVFDLNVKNSMVLSAEVAMIIPNALKATVMIAANAPKSVVSGIADRDKVGIFKSLSRGVSDRYVGVKTVGEGKAEIKAKVDRDVADALSQTTTTKTTPTKPGDLENSARNKGWHIELSGDEKSAAINFIFNKLEEQASTNKISALIPLDLTITIDGIAGLTWGNAFTVSYLPNKYRENAVFQIKDISHEVSSDGWTTKIVGLMRPKYNGIAVSIPNPDTTATVLSDGTAIQKQSGTEDAGSTDVNDVRVAQTNQALIGLPGQQ